MDEVPEFNNLWDVIEYAWVAGAYWIKALLDRVRTLEEKVVNTPTKEEVEARVDKELYRINNKLERVENLLIDMMKRKQDPHIKL